MMRTRETAAQPLRVMSKLEARQGLEQDSGLLGHQSHGFRGSEDGGCEGEDGVSSDAPEEP